MNCLKIIINVFLFLLFETALFAQSETTVFESGTNGYKTFRIPAIIKLPEGTLLAFCEGRVNGPGDFGDNDIVMKRSTDKGHSWSALQVVADYGDLQCSNPAPVFDHSDPAFPNGRIFLFYNTGTCKESDMLKGKGLVRCMYKTSVDGGISWSDPVDITRMVHRPLKPEADTAFHFMEDWRYYANTPGHAVQLRYGVYAGRIYVAANHSAGQPQPAAMHYQAHGYYSDDHGKTFHLCESVTFKGSNESMAAEISGNGLIMNSRNQKGNVRARIVSLSHDGGANWDTTYFDHQLPDPVCQGSILNLGMKHGKQVLAFCNAADTSHRNNLTLRISRDEGQTWKYKKIIASAPEGFKGDYSAYSDLVSTGRKRIGILYEKENYSRIVFTMVKY